MARERPALNFRDAEMERFRRIWERARQGDAKAQEDLLHYLASHKSVDAFVRYWQKMKDMAKPEKPTFSDDLNRPVSPAKEKAKTPWERAKTTLTNGRVHVVQGGLPSLGKRSK